MPVSVAIVGAGPSGFYTADALIKLGVDCRIDLIDRLPSPHGLIRGGVAPDHQKTKNVTKAFDRTAGAECVRYYGNVEIGGKISLEELCGLYDAVVLSTGAPLDRPLGIPGEDKRGVIGSAAFVGWYNGHPDFCDLDPPLGCRAVAVIGNGNVAIDIARVLVKTRAEMASSDLPDYAARAIEASPVTDVYMFGRRGPVEAKFTNVELREMGKLGNAVPALDAGQLPDAVTGEWSDRDRRLRERNLATLKDFVGIDPGAREKRVHFAFYAAPVEILGGERVEGLRLERTEVVDGRARGTGEMFDIECGLVLPAIGYRSEPVPGAPFDDKAGLIPNDDGRVSPGLYAAGWVKRGPTGVIGTNKPDGERVAEHIRDDFAAGAKPGREAFEALLAGTAVRPVSFAEWKEIEAAEIAAAPAGAPRRKLVTIPDMLAVLDQGTGRTGRTGTD